MTRAEEYRHLADLVRDRASKTDDPNLAGQWERLADGYALQAEQTKGQSIGFQILEAPLGARLDLYVKLLRGLREIQ